MTPGSNLVQKYVWNRVAASPCASTPLLKNRYSVFTHWHQVAPYAVGGLLRVLMGFTRVDGHLFREEGQAAGMLSACRRP